MEGRAAGALPVHDAVARRHLLVPVGSPAAASTISSSTACSEPKTT